MASRRNESGKTSLREFLATLLGYAGYTVLEAGPRFKIKRIEVKPGGKLSMQMHHHRSEHWVVVSGTAEVTCEERVLLLGEGETLALNVTQAYGVLNPQSQFANRATFVVDKQGVIQHIEEGNGAIDPTGAITMCSALKKKESGQ